MTIQLEDRIRELDPRLAFIVSKIANLPPNEIEIVKVAALIRIAEATETEGRFIGKTLEYVL